MPEHIPLPYPRVRVTAILYRRAERHAAVYYATVPLWCARWRYLSWRIRRSVLAALNESGPHA